MYKRNLSVAVLGVTDDLFEAISSTPAPDGLSVSASRSLDPDKGADAIIVDIDSASQELPELLAKAPASDIIAIAPPDRVEGLEREHTGLWDIWTSPISPQDGAWRWRRYLRAKREEADAWETAQYLEQTINSMPSLVWYKSSDGVHEKVNNAFCNATGKTRDQAEGARHAYIWDVDDDDPACIESERQVMESRSTVVSEEVIKVGDDTRILTTYKSPLYDWDGEPMGTVGVGIDITRERAYEEKILEKNKTLETIITSLQCGVLTHSLDGQIIVNVNQAALEMLGYSSADEMVEDGFDMVAASVIPEDAARMRAEMANMLDVGDTVSTEYRVRHRDGTERHIMGSVKLIENNGEKLFQRFLVDYTDKKIEEAVKEQRQRDLIQALSEDYLLVCTFNLDTGIGEALRVEDRDGIQLSDHFAGELNLGASIGSYIDDAVTREDRAMLRSALSAMSLLDRLADMKRMHVNYRTERNGKVAYCQATVVRTGNWRLSREVVIGFRNVDQQTRDEMKKKELLESALDRANKASEAKSQFLSNMSHDIRTPMNAIVGFTALAESRMDQPDKVLEYLDKIQRSSTHLLSLIDDILDMSLIERGQVSLSEQPCCIPELMDEIESIVHADLVANRLELSLDVSTPTHPYVLCDKLRISQVLLNLLGNAVKFTNPGGSIALGVEEVGIGTNGYGTYRFTVTDTGIGMERSFLEHIFDPFERERTSTVSGVEGSGIGLAITKNLVDMMNGSIEVTSEPGRGSVFTVELSLRIDEVAETEDAASLLKERACPLPDACTGCDGSPIPGGQACGGTGNCVVPGWGRDDDAARSEAAGSGSASDQSQQRSADEPPMAGARILLVDDNMLNREIAITLLEDTGYTVEFAVDGQDALDKLAQAGPGHFQLVLMDIQMPVMNGYDATRAIRSMDDPEIASIPIIAVTADALDEDRQKAFQVGMDEHLSKPIDMERLFERMVTVERNREGR